MSPADFCLFAVGFFLIGLGGQLMNDTLLQRRFNRENARRQERLLRKIRDAQRGEQPQNYR
jgi:hypothetical protein